MTENNTIPPQVGNYFYRRNRTDEIEDDRTEGIENKRRINDHLQEVTLVREDVVSYGFENPGILLEDFTPWIRMLHLEKSISCISKIQYAAMVLFEITTKSETDRRHISRTLEQIVIHGAGLRKFENRELKDIRRTRYHVSFCFVALFLGCTSTGQVGLWFLWFYVQEHPKMYHVTSTMFA